MAIRRDTTSIRFAHPDTPPEIPQGPWAQETPPGYDDFAMMPEPYEPLPTDDIVGLDGLTRTRKELKALLSMRGRLDKEHAGDVRESRRGFGLGPYSDRFT
jgi:hypothetical protein